MSEDHELTRREFGKGFMAVGAVTLGGAGPLPQTAVPDDLQDTVRDYGFVAAPVLVGGLDERPAPGDGFFDNKTGVYLYKTDGSAGGGGALYWIAVDDGDPVAGWSEFPMHLAGFEPTDLPTDPATGTLLFDEFRNLPTWFDTDHWEYPNFVDDVLTEDVVVADTTQRTTVFDPDINMNSLVAGRTYQLDLMGKFSTANNSARFTIDITLAGAGDVAGIGNVGGNVTDAPWSVEFTFTVREDGVNGVLQPHTRGLFNSDPADSHHDPVLVDTTTATMFNVDVQWTAADPDNSVTLGQAHLKQMG